MAKHTPGPWEVRSLDGSLGTIDTADGAVAVAQAMEVSAKDRCSGSPERRANAILIAGAPEMFRALEVILSTLDALDEMDNLRHIARAAIAKATGEQQ